MKSFAFVHCIPYESGSLKSMLTKKPRKINEVHVLFRAEYKPRG